jgi:hypothetical protein
MLNTKKWPEIKKWFKLRKFKLVSSSDTKEAFRSLFVKDDKVAIVTKAKRGKITNIAWLDWTNVEPNDILLNETYYLEESLCEHERVRILSGKLNQSDIDRLAKKVGL